MSVQSHIYFGRMQNMGICANTCPYPNYWLMAMFFTQSLKRRSILRYYNMALMIIRKPNHEEQRIRKALLIRNSWYSSSTEYSRPCLSLENWILKVKLQLVKVRLKWVWKESDLRQKVEFDGEMLSSWNFLHFSAFIMKWRLRLNSIN